MNFQDLLTKMKTIDEGVDVPVEECGMEMMPHHAPEQSDSVTMNVSMNGSGSGGIRDLMAILKNIEDAGEEPMDHGDVDALFGGPDNGIEVVADEEFANEPEVEISDLGAVLPTGDDLASKGEERPKVNGGGNPMQETLISKLSELYSEVKLR
jgi:hypothetical protein